MVAVAVHQAETRDEVLEVATLLFAFVGMAHAAVHWSLRDWLVERAADVLAESYNPGVPEPVTCNACELPMSCSICESCGCSR